MKILLLHPKMGIAGDMTAASLFDVFRKLDNKAEVLISEFLSLFGGYGDIMVQYEGDGYQLTTGFKDATTTYFEAQSFQERIIQAVKLGPSYAEVSRRTLSILIEAESFVHKQAFMNFPGDWNPDKFMLPPETSSVPQSTTVPFRNSSKWPRGRHHPDGITEIRLAPIGVAHTPYVNQDAPNQPSLQLQFENEKNEDEIHRLQFSIELHPQFTSALEDLTKFKYIYVISYLNQVEDYTATQIVPPWDSTQTKRGLFATRSPNRPNPIGISVVRLLQVDKNIIFVDSLDLFDSTPILDIKPYIESIDSRDANNGWISDSDHLLLHRLGVVHTHTYSISENTQGHLHEASDIIIDSVLPMKILELLEVPVENTFLIPPVFIGGGTISFSHGTLKVPVPAVKYILEKYHIPSQPGPVHYELATPTGVALLAALDITKRQLPDTFVNRVIQTTDSSVVLKGKGLGTKKILGHENALYVYLVSNAENYLMS